MMDIIGGRVYLIVTYWGYPFGGGEEFMYDTMEWASTNGMLCYWLSFVDGKTGKNYDETNIISTEHGTMINIDGGFDIQKLSNWIYLIRPDIVHQQGHFREEIYKATEQLNIEYITGIHFWNGVLLLDEKKRNIDINLNKEVHKTDPEFLRMFGKKRVTYYCASFFVKETIENITGKIINDIIFPSSSSERYYVKKKKPKYVTIINIHRNKGGNLVFKLLEECKDISFMCVMTEPGSEDLDKNIFDIIENRNINGYSVSKYIQRTQNIKDDVYRKTKIILCPTNVDETFCRVVNESMMNGIPVLTTGVGNIKYLIGDSCPELKTYDDWKFYLRKLYFDKNYFENISKKVLLKYGESSEKIAKKQFIELFEKIISNGKEQNVCIFSPWCDQGLGIQSRNYYKILNKHFRMFIFSYKPYNSDSCFSLQKNKSEWEVDCKIYYSDNCREDVKDSEIIDFCNEHNIGKFIIPETCWNRIFQIAKILREIGVKAYAIPNIEIVRKDELHKHNFFHKILANNIFCKKIMEKYVTIPVEYIGYSINGIKKKNKKIKDEIKFIFIGGMNAFSRKNLLDVCEAFLILSHSYPHIKLTATVQMSNTLEVDLINKINRYKNVPNINIIEKHMKYEDIIQLYYENHVTIHVSKHEGLGLGFYESISSGTPVLTLDTPPHNEIIIDGTNGWTIPCHYKKMTDNKDPIFDSAYFYPDVLSKKIIEISNPEIIKKMIKNLDEDLQKRFKIDYFENNIIKALSN
jgi:glycosyltransferase involved in cell wall biosynthesis